MPKLITIHGPVGAGKSTLTEQLRKRLPTYSYVDRPFIKRGLKPAGRKNALKLSKKASYFLIKELVKLKQDIIVQEVSSENLKAHFPTGFFPKNKYTIVPFYIKCSVETSIKRDLDRPAKIVGEKGVRKIHEEYLSPLKTEIIIDTDKLSVKKAIKKMIGCIEQK